MTYQHSKTALQVVVMLGALMSAPAFAATYLVPSGSYPDIDTAMTAANASGGSDVIEIGTAGTYTITGTVQPAADQDLEFKATVAGVILEKTATSAVINPLTSAGTGSVIRVTGVNSANRITLRKAGTGGQPVINTGGGPNRLILQDVTLERTSSTDGRWILINSTGASHSFTNVNLTGGGAGTTNLTDLTPGAASTVTLTNVDASVPAVAGSFFNVNQNLTLNANSCKLEAGTGVNRTLFAFVAASVPSGTYTLTDCSFRAADSSLVAVFCDFAFGQVTAPTLNLVRPVFAGGCGLIGFRTNVAAVTINITGASAASKTDITNSKNDGNILFARMNAGTLTLTDLKMTARQGYVFADSVDIAGNVNLNYNRCDFTAGSGDYRANTNNGPGTAVGKITITGLNTIWTGTGSGQTSILSINTSGDDLQPSAITLNHCTLAYPGNGAVGTLVNVNIAADDVTFPVSRGDVLTANYCLFDGTGGVADGRCDLAGTLNALKGGSVTGFAGSMPGDTAFYSVPTSWNLDANGRINGIHIANNYATTSAETQDVDGTSRPQGAARDSGANEVTFAPVSVSALSIE